MDAAILWQRRAIARDTSAGKWESTRNSGLVFFLSLTSRSLSLRILCRLLNIEWLLRSRFAYPIISCPAGVDSYLRAKTVAKTGVNTWQSSGGRQRIMASKWSAKDSELDVADEDSSADGSLELREWLLEGQSSSDCTTQSPRHSNNSSTSFRRHWKRRHLVERRWTRLKEWLHWTPCSIIIRLVRFLLVFAFGSLCTL